MDKQKLLITTRVSDRIEVVHIYRDDDTPANIQLVLPTGEQVWCSYIKDDKRHVEDGLSKYEAALVELMTPKLPPYREFTPSIPDLYKVGSVDITDFGTEVRATVSPGALFSCWATCKHCDEPVGTKDVVQHYEYCPMCGEEVSMDEGFEYETRYEEDEV